MCKTKNPLGKSRGQAVMDLIGARAKSACLATQQYVNALKLTLSPDTTAAEGNPRGPVPLAPSTSTDRPGGGPPGLILDA